MNDLVYTPEETAELLKLSKATIYELIKRGEIIAKRLGNTYRIPRKSLAFAFEGMDQDILDAEKSDQKLLGRIHNAIDAVRKDKPKT